MENSNSITEYHPINLTAQVTEIKLCESCRRIENNGCNECDNKGYIKREYEEPLKVYDTKIKEVHIEKNFCPKCEGSGFYRQLDNPYYS